MEFTIGDVARLHGLTVIKTNSSETYCVCPFCGDKRGKFSYIIKKGNKTNMYHCFKCDESGNSIDLHIKLSMTDYSSEDGRKRAARDIYSALNADNLLFVSHKEDLKALETNESIKAPDNICSNVYYALLKECELKKEHKDDLLRRGLSEADIKKFRFKSTPKNTKQVCKTLINKGFNLEGVPGFYKNKGVWDLRIVNSGYFCPVYDGDFNLIIGFQIRVDKPYNDAKYLWLSSAGKDSGVSPGALTTYLPGKNSRVVIATEGILKATIIYCLLNGEVSVMGIPGTKSYKSSQAYLERLNSYGFVFEAYDMDKALRTTSEKEEKKTADILKAAEDLKTLIKSYKLGVHTLKWDSDKEGLFKGNFKGLDDFLLDYERKDIFINYLISKSADVLKMQKYFNL